MRWRGKGSSSSGRTATRRCARPSRQSLITGKLPHAVGVTQLTTRLSDDVLTMGEWFRDLDYRTAAIGKMHFNGPSAHGFAVRLDTPDWQSYLREHPPRGGDHRRPWRPFQDPAAVWLNAGCRSTGLPVESMQSTYFVDRAIEFLERQASDRPFAADRQLLRPAQPVPLPRGVAAAIPAGDFPVPPVSDRDRREQPAIFASLTPDEVRGIQAAYYTSLSFVDSQVGRLIRGLDELKLSERTLVVYVGDNGYMLGQHGRFEKHCFYEPAVRIPLIMRWPGTLPGGRRIDELVEMVDVLPTILHLMRLPAPPDLQGIDLEPLLRGKPGARGHDVVFSEYLENEEAMVRSARFKLIVGTGRRHRQDGYQTGKPLPGPYQRLFDLVDDPGETRDLADDPGHQAVKDDLLRRMYLRMTTTRDGLEPVPAGPLRAARRSTGASCRGMCRPTRNRVFLGRPRILPSIPGRIVARSLNMGHDPETAAMRRKNGRCTYATPRGSSSKRESMHSARERP